MSTIDFDKFPTTRYQGSKRKILPWIYESVKDLEFDTVLDAFGGSASVSYLFKKMGKSVTYNDKLKFNSLIGKAIIENDRNKLSSEDLKNLFQYIQKVASPNFIQDNFKGMYYLDEENRWLDEVSYGIINMNHYTGQILEYKKALAFYALFQASMIKRPFNLFHRKNLNIRTNDVERNFGNKTTWDKDFEDHFNNFIKEANSLVFKGEKRCFALNYPVLEMPNTEYDLVYLDTPYLNTGKTNETSNYLKCYHFLEGIANYNDWSKLIDYNTINRRFINTNEQNEFKPSTIEKTFEDILDKFRNSIIVLSYKQGGIPSIEYLEQLMRKFKTHVEVKSVHYKYALNKQNGNASKNREVLIIGR